MRTRSSSLKTALPSRVSLRRARPPRRMPGQDAGKVIIASDFDAPLPADVL
jgi:hypothetical protein